MSFYNQINEDGLVSCKNLAKLNIQEGYSIVPLVHKSWKSAEKRLLVVIETIDSLDLKNGYLLSGLTEDPGSYGDAPNDHNPMKSVFSSIPDLALELLSPYGIKFEEASGGFAFGICNFNAKKIRNLDVNSQKAAFPSFTDRVIEVIKALKPTHVLVSGDTANKYLLEKLDHVSKTPKHLRRGEVHKNSQYKRGWVLKRRVGDTEFFYTPTLDIETLYKTKKGQFDEEDEEVGADSHAAGDLLFFVCRNIANLFAERMLHSIANLRPNPILVETIEQFDAFYEKLLACSIVATDTETKSLANTNNAIYIAQFAMTVEEAYVIPIEHPKSPFSPEDVKYIYSKLRKFLLSKKSKIIVTLGGMFDYRIFRTVLDIPIIPHHKAHEITAGEQLLDENIGLFSRFKIYMDGEYVKTSYQNLAAMCCLYGNDWYYRAAFSKSERHLAGSYDYKDPDLLLYCAADVCFPLGIALEQHKAAHNQLVKPSRASKKVRYSAYFEKMLLNVMNNTVHSISHMEQDGSPMDVPYLELLRGPKSPLHKIVKDTTKELLSMPSVRTASGLLLGGQGKAQTSLFGDDISMTMFDPNKKSHLETLFFDVMKLPVVGRTKTGQRAIDKKFTAAYSSKFKEVELKDTLTKANKLLSTYVKGWLEIMRQSVDSMKDDALRASFGFFTIVTGRLNSFNPSFQQTPSRGVLADYIKRAFIAPEGYLNVRYDYSSHEVRGWSILSGDKRVAESFREGLELRRRLIQTSTRLVPKELSKEESIIKSIEEDKDGKKKSALKTFLKIVQIRDLLKKKGDVHIQNAFRFFKVWIDKSSPLRDAVKQLVFGVLYGKGAKTLARDLKSQRLSDLSALKRSLEKELEAAKKNT